MARRMLVAVSLGALALALSSTALATKGARRPSFRGCLVAWNSPANHANRVRLLAQRPFSGLQLSPGAVAVNTWTKTSKSQTSSAACLLTVEKPGHVRVAEGYWDHGGVSYWSWGRSIPVSFALPANVRLLAGGRLAKIYRH